MRIRHAIPVIFASLAFTIIGCSSGPATLDEVIADLDEKTSRIDTYDTDISASMTMGAMDMNFGGNIKGKGQLMAATMDMNLMQQPLKMRMITDASNTLWMDMDVMGMRQVMKMDMAQMVKLQEQMLGGAMPGGMGGFGGMQNDPRHMLKQMAQTFELTYVGKEDLDGERVYVLDGKLKDELAAKFEEAGANQNPFAQGMGMAGDMMASVRIKFGVKDGFVRTQEMLNETGEPWMTMKYENTTLNGSIDDSVFTYAPPPGVVVMDMSEMADQAMSEEDADAAAGVQPE